MATSQAGHRKERFEAARRPMVLGIVVNFGLALVKFLAGFFGHSYALIADAIESCSDVVTSTGVLLGLRYAAKPADEDHPHGHGKAEPLAATFVSVVLLIIAGSVAVESVHMIHTPHRTPAAYTLIVLIGVLVVKETLFRLTMKVGRDVDSTAVKSEAFHQRSDAITSVAAFIGISVALIGGPGYETADDWAALLASGVIAYNAATLFRNALRELLDKAPPAELADQVSKLATSVAGVLGTHKCFVRKVGLDYLVDLDILVEGEITVRAGHDLAHDVQDKIRAEMPTISRVLVHVEPIDEYGRKPIFEPQP